MSRARRHRLLPPLATALAIALALAFLVASSILHRRIGRWQDNVARGAEAIRKVSESSRALTPLVDAAVALEPPLPAAVQPGIAELARRCDELALDPSLAPLGHADPIATVRRIAQRLHAAAASIESRLAPELPPHDRLAGGRWLYQELSSCQRDADTTIVELRRELGLVSIEMRDCNDLAQALLAVACAVAAALALALWVRQRDVERRLTIERQHAASALHLDVIVDRAPLFIWSVDRELRFGYLRGSALPAPRSGTIEEMVGKTLFDYFGTSDRTTPAIRHHLLALAGEPQRYAIRWQERDFLVHVEPRREDGQVVGALGAAIETTAQTQMQVQLTRSQERVLRLEKMEAIGRLADFVAHDFNNFLTVVLGYAGSVLQELPRESPIRFEIEEIARTAERATWLTRQLLAFSRPARIEAEAIDLAASVRALLPVLRRQCGDRIRIVDDLAASVPPILAHRTQVEQIILNLSLNARDAMPDGGTLSLAVAADPPATAQGDGNAEAGVLLIVRDDGIGMDEEIRARLFEPFFSTKEEGHGSGLGLAIVEAIVRERGGTINVESAPGKGATFVLRFPAATGIELDPVVAPAAPPPLGRGERILLVEDDDAVRKLAARVLESHGYRVTSARGAREALDLLVVAPAPFDLVLSDERMPRQSGSELFAELRRERPELRTMLMSTHADGNTRAAESTGAGFLAKPFTAAELLTAVRGALDARR